MIAARSRRAFGCSANAIHSAAAPTSVYRNRASPKDFHDLAPSALL